MISEVNNHNKASVYSTDSESEIIKWIPNDVLIKAYIFVCSSCKSHTKKKSKPDRNQRKSYAD